jgi:anti-sigma factor RsiW
MTSHISNDELLWDYLHELLDPALVNEFEAHLAGCNACQQALEVARADCAQLAAATRLDGPFPLFETPDELAPATLPLKPAWRSTSGGRWPWAAAAAVLFAVGLPFIGYQMGSLNRGRALNEAENELVAAHQQRENFRERIEADKAVAINELQAKHPILQVHGPTDYQPNLANTFRVRTTDLAGHSLPARLTARVKSDKDGSTLFETRLQSDGDAQIALPNLPLAPGSKAELELLAQGERVETPELVRSVLEVRPALLTTHLALEKYIYHPGEKVLFRSVTLDRATWKPEATPSAIRYELTGPGGSRMLDGTTRDGGIGGGEFALPANAPAGTYQLTATDADGRFSPASRSLRVDNGALPPARLNNIEFYPEGGNLIAGVATRVFFSARDTNNEPIELDGLVVDGKGELITTIQSADLQARPHLGRGRGVFMLTPKKGDRYFVRNKNATIQEPQKHEIAKVHDVGLGLALTNRVIRPTDPIEATVFSTGERLQVVLGVFVHDRLVAEHPLTLHRGANTARMAAPAGLVGIYRVAVFPAHAGAYQPLAEGLGFCRDGAGLQVAWEVATRDGKRFLKVRNGAGTSEKSWFAVSVQPANDAVLLDHVISNALLSGLVLRQELNRTWREDQLTDLLRDDPATDEALELYLGLQSPTPRVPKATTERPALVRADGMRPDGESLAMLNLDNEEGARSKIASGLASQFASARAQERVLADQESLAQSKSDAARVELEGYQERASALFRPLLGLVVVSLFAIGCIGLTMSIYRTLSHQAGARSWVLAAGGALAACLVFVGMSPFQNGALPGGRTLDPLKELALEIPPSSTQIALNSGDYPVAPVFNASVGRPPLAIDRSKPLPVAAVQAQSHWLPAIASNDGTCEIELTAPAGKLGHVLQIDVFTASGKVGSTTALIEKAPVKQ